MDDYFLIKTKENMEIALSDCYYKFDELKGNFILAADPIITKCVKEDNEKGYNGRCWDIYESSKVSTDGLDFRNTYILELIKDKTYLFSISEGIFLEVICIDDQEVIIINNGGNK